MKLSIFQHCSAAAHEVMLASSVVKIHHGRTVLAKYVSRVLQSSQHSVEVAAYLVRYFGDESAMVGSGSTPRRTRLCLPSDSNTLRVRTCNEFTEVFFLCELAQN